MNIGCQDKQVNKSSSSKQSLQVRDKDIVAKVLILTSVPEVTIKFYGKLTSKAKTTDWILIGTKYSENKEDIRFSKSTYLSDKSAYFEIKAIVKHKYFKDCETIGRFDWGYTGGRKMFSAVSLNAKPEYEGSRELRDYMR